MMKKSLFLLPWVLWGCQETGNPLISTTTGVQIAPRLMNASGKYPAQVDSVRVTLAVAGVTVKDTICPWSVKQLPGLVVDTGAAYALTVKGRVADDPYGTWRWAGSVSGVTGSTDESVLLDTVVVDTVPTPSIPSPSGNYATAFSTIVSGLDSVRYTTDGSNPYLLSNAGGQVAVGASMSLRARAFKTAQGVILSSPMVERNYQIVNRAVPALPTVTAGTGTSAGAYTVHFTAPEGAYAEYFNPASGAYVPADSLEIRYTQKVSLHSRLTGDTLTGPDTVCTFAVSNSAVPAVLFSIPSGTYHASQTVALTTADTAAAIYYSLNGGSSWQTYSQPLLISTSVYADRAVTITARVGGPSTGTSLESKLYIYLK